MKNNLVKLGIDVRPEVREKFKKACEDNNTNASKVLKDFVNNYIFESEEKKMEEMIKELKEELLNKKMTLVEMDNTAQGITNCTEGIFDYLEDCLAQNSVAYYITEDKNIIVEFEVVKENDDATKIEVKVTDIWED
jgi:hypothetical protein